MPAPSPPNFICPKCQTLIDPPPWPGRCGSCDARVGVLDFDPVPEDVEAPAAALPEDVACVTHPGKRAVAACAGTGNYICSLCAVNMLGETYSAAFIESGGLDTLKQSDTFQRHIGRPDSTALLCVLLSFFLSCTLVGGPICWIVALAFFFRHRKLAREGGFYQRRIASSGTTAGLVVLLLLSALLNCAVLWFFFADLMRAY